MRKLNFLLILAFATIISSCSKEDLSYADEDQNLETPLSKSEIDNEITRILKEKGSFNWSEASDLMLWSAVLKSDSLISIGYGNKAFNISPENGQSLSKANIMTEISNSGDYSPKTEKWSENSYK